MSELRKDPIIGQWVSVRTKDSLMPENYVKDDHTQRHAATCQFCPDREHLTPPEVDALRHNGSIANAPGWQVRVVPNKFPALKIEGTLDELRLGLYEQSNGIGAHEVVIENPAHEKNMADYTIDELAAVIEQYQRRIRDLTKDKRFKYIIVFKNYGESAGTSVEHAHSQIIALPMVPKYVLGELEGIGKHYHTHQRCVFCDIIAQEQEENERIISVNDEFIAFCPYVSRYAFEFWIAPKAHGLKFTAMERASGRALAGILKDALQRLKACLSDPSFNYYLHIAPVNTGGLPDYHWHIEVVPKLRRTTGFELGTGFYVVHTSPEKAAGYLRAAPVAAAGM